MQTHMFTQESFHTSFRKEVERGVKLQFVLLLFCFFLKSWCTLMILALGEFRVRPAWAMKTKMKLGGAIC